MDHRDRILSSTFAIVRGNAATEAWSDADWVTAIGEIHRLRVAALVGWGIEQDLLAAPEWVAEALVPVHRFFARHSADYRRCAEDIAGHLGDRDIPCAFRKGVVLDHAYYPAVGTRPYTDLDVLVRPEHLAAAEAAMISAGFRCVDPRAASHWVASRRTDLRPPGRRYVLLHRLATGGAPPFVRLEEAATSEVKRIAVDLVSTSLPPSPHAPSLTERMIETAVPIADTSIHGPSGHDLLIDLAANYFLSNTTVHYIRRERFRRLTNLLDIALVLGSPEFDGAQLRARVVEADAATVVELALLHVRDVFPGAVPDSLETWLAGLDVRDAYRIAHAESSEPIFWDVAPRDRPFVVQGPNGLPSSTLESL